MQILNLKTPDDIGLYRKCWKSPSVPCQGEQIPAQTTCMLTPEHWGASEFSRWLLKQGTAVPSVQGYRPREESLSPLPSLYSSSPEAYPAAATGNREQCSSLPFQGQRGSTQLAVNTSELRVRGKEQNKEKNCILLSQHLLGRWWKLWLHIKWRSRDLSKTTGGEKQMGKGEGEGERGRERERARALQQRSYALPIYAGTYHKNRKIQRESD